MAPTGFYNSISEKAFHPWSLKLDIYLVLRTTYTPGGDTNDNYKGCNNTMQFLQLTPHYEIRTVNQVYAYL